jgi:hypothetical protein
MNRKGAGGPSLAPFFWAPLGMRTGERDAMRLGRCREIRRRKRGAEVGAGKKGSHSP